MNPRKILPILLGLGVMPASAVLGQEQSNPAWDTLKLLLGSWQGTIDGGLGTGTAVRKYELILGGRFLLSRHSSVRLPQPQSPGGDNHEEWGIFSFDRSRAKVIYRQFVIENFVNQYVCEIDPSRPTFVCLTESVENGDGLRARWTVTMVNRHTFDEVFELAAPGADFEEYFVNHWTRMPRIE